MKWKNPLSRAERKPFRLIFHIGAGKTGTSSIQTSLKEATDTLRSNGYDYWGLMLESAPVKLYDWQKASVSKDFPALQPTAAVNQLQSVLEQSIAASRDQGIHTAIWSHEWFFRRHHNVIPALKAVEAEDVRIEIVAYVRRHDAWAKSAYVQWGLMHKTYHGPLMPFRQYIKERPVRFARTLGAWAKAFPNSFHLRNFDVAGDVVKDFVAALNLPKSIPSIRVNEAPGSEELFLRALFNNGVQGQSFPVDFNRRFQLKRPDFTLNPNEWLASLLPTEEDLGAVAEDAADDCSAVNWMLEANCQPVLTKHDPKSKPSPIDLEKLTAAIVQIVFRQNEKLRKLQNQVNQLTKNTGINDI